MGQAPVRALDTDPPRALSLLRSGLGRGRQHADALREARVGSATFASVETPAAELPEHEILAFARDLVAIPSENPPGTAYDECVRRICAELDALGIHYEIVQTGVDDTHRQAILANAGHSGPLLYLHGHYPSSSGPGSRTVV